MKRLKEKLTEFSVLFVIAAASLLVILVITGIAIEASVVAVATAIYQSELLMAMIFVVFAVRMVINHHFDITIKSNQSQDELMDRSQPTGDDKWPSKELFIRMLRCPYGHSRAFKLLDMPVMGHSIPVECPVCERQFTISSGGIAGVIEHDAEAKESPEKTA